MKLHIGGIYQLGPDQFDIGVIDIAEQSAWIITASEPHHGRIMPLTKISREARKYLGELGDRAVFRR